jgi:hypothetical protein
MWQGNFIACTIPKFFFDSGGSFSNQHRCVAHFNNIAAMGKKIFHNQIISNEHISD